MPSFTFEKSERLKSRKIIERMFNREGQSFARYPLRIIWIETALETPYPAQFALSVPKKKFPKAVDRNRIRRQIRESYRLHKHLLYNALELHQKQYALMVLYTGKEAVSYTEIEAKMKQIILKLVNIAKRDKR